MTEIALVAAIVAAVVATGLRRWRRLRLGRAARGRPGSSPEQAIWIRSWGEVDERVAARWCGCGGYLERLGEGSRVGNGRRYRVARLRCQECEAIEELFFDTTDVLH